MCPTDQIPDLDTPIRGHADSDAFGGSRRGLKGETGDPAAVAFEIADWAARVGGGGRGVRSE